MQQNKRGGVKAAGTDANFQVGNEISVHTLERPMMIPPMLPGWIDIWWYPGHGVNERRWLRFCACKVQHFACDADDVSGGNGR